MANGLHAARPDDRSPSLSIRETSDGTFLLHCFAACTAADIVAAVGLELRDLFPDRLASGKHRLKPKAPRIHPAEILTVLHDEIYIVLVAAHAATKGALEADDLCRLETSIQRIEAAIKLAVATG